MPFVHTAEKLKMVRYATPSENTKTPRVASRPIWPTEKPMRRNSTAPRMLSRHGMKQPLITFRLFLVGALFAVISFAPCMPPPSDGSSGSAADIGGGPAEPRLKAPRPAAPRPAVVGSATPETNTSSSAMSNRGTSGGAKTAARSSGVSKSSALPALLRWHVPFISPTILCTSLGPTKLRLL